MEKNRKISLVTILYVIISIINDNNNNDIFNLEKKIKFLKPSSKNKYLNTKNIKLNKSDNVEFGLAKEFPVYTSEQENKNPVFFGKLKNNRIGTYLFKRD